MGSVRTVKIRFTAPDHVEREAVKRVAAYTRRRLIVTPDFMSVTARSKGQDILISFLVDVPDEAPDVRDHCIARMQAVVRSTTQLYPAKAVETWVSKV